MAEPHVVTALSKKRAELSGDIERTQQLQDMSRKPSIEAVVAVTGDDEHAGAELFVPSKSAGVSLATTAHDEPPGRTSRIPQRRQGRPVQRRSRACRYRRLPHEA